MTKKGHQKFCRMKIENFLRKGKIGKIFYGVRKFFGNGVSETVRNASLPQRDGRPCLNVESYSKLADFVNHRAVL